MAATSDDDSPGETPSREVSNMISSLSIAEPDAKTLSSGSADHFCFEDQYSDSDFDSHYSTDAVSNPAEETDRSAGQLLNFQSERSYASESDSCNASGSEVPFREGMVFHAGYSPLQKCLDSMDLVASQSVGDLTSLTTQREHERFDAESTSAERCQNANRVLIEKDGKFELVDPDEIKAEYFGLLNIGPADEAPSVAKSGVSQAGRQFVKSPKSSISKVVSPEYLNLKSKYAMSESQKEMKRRHVDAVRMRKMEERQRLKEEEERRRADAEKSFQKWLAGKVASARERQNLQSAAEERNHTERSSTANDAYSKWLRNKELFMKEQRELERARLADEAQSYVIRDRHMCDRAFRQWCDKKRMESAKKEAYSKASRPSSRPKKISAASSGNSRSSKSTSGSWSPDDDRGKRLSAGPTVHYVFSRPVPM